MKAAAIEVFEKYPDAKECFITPDNQAFLSENRARIHDKDFVTAKRSDVMDAEPTAPKGEKKSAEELIATAKECQTVEELDALGKDETRKTVLAAIAERRAELTKQQ